MERYKLILLVILGFVAIGNLYSIPPTGGDTGKKPTVTEKRNDCLFGTNSIELDINNVRARLKTSGDIWWDGTRAQYIVPKPSDPSIPGAASIYAGGVWLGGRDGAGNLKVAVSTFPNISSTDFWPGPLTPEGTTDRATCATWDVFWTVYLDEILEFRSIFLRAQEEGRTVTLDSVPIDLLKWPGFGNPFFQEYNGFALPETDQPLAGFFDANDDGIYNPLDGDLPAIEIRGCPISPDQIPDMMVFWIYNDNGNTHTESNGLPMQMEVQAQAFAYQTSDEINDMTFIRYKLLNRASAPISDTYFAMWVDPDLGCSDDDYVGCDTSRSLAIIYNSDAVDGTSGCTCGSQVTYCNNVPILGIDYFRGPLGDSITIDSFGNEIPVSYELGMSSFTYYNNSSTEPNINKTDPTTVEQYYFYLTGRWRDGSPFTQGGDGYDPEGIPIKYAFPSEANDINGWSMCSESLAPVDLRTIQASGPFVLNVGRINELIVGLPWVSSQNYPCPSFSEIFAADDKAQALFDNCFDLTDGPDAPDVSVIELDREVIFTLTNANSPTSNNENEQYMEIDAFAPESVPDSLKFYKFQGYLVYQLKNSEVGRSEFNDPDKARLVLQMDVRDSISKIYNWVGVAGRNETENFLIPELKVDGTNQGIRKTFSITNDAFAVNDVRLVNHKKYFYSVLAYAHNEYLPYDPDNDTLFQANVYLEGRRNIQTYTVIPKKIIDLNLNSEYGDGVVVTRIDGKGNPMTMLELNEESKLAVEDFDNFDGKLSYVEGRGPITVTIFNPIDIVDGNFSLKLLDDNLSDDFLDPDGFWELTNLDTDEVIFSEVSLEQGNEQLISEYGFSITLNYGINVGDVEDPRFGVVGSSISYDDLGNEWIKPITNNTFRLEFGPTFQAQLFTYLLTGPNMDDNLFDPNQQFNRIANEIGFAPFSLTSHATNENVLFFTPAGASNVHPLARGGADFIKNLRNVDIVYTNDKNLWSRCIVVETSHRTLDAPNFGDGTERPWEPLEVKEEPSVSKEVDENGNPIRETSSTGFSWFPGYAVDVETGQRLNIFFGEGSAYSADNPRLTNDDFPSGVGTGNDMIFNPTADEVLTNILDPNGFDALDYVLGGHHYVYVASTAYDECAVLSNQLRSSSLIQARNGYRTINWAGMMMLDEDSELLSYENGLIPNKTRISLRVGKQYAVTTGEERTGDGYPEYEFTIEGKEAVAKVDESLSEALDLINVVPNPYYASSEYEVNSNLNIVKITNLPYESEVSIYTLNGDFVRRFDRNVSPIPATRANQGVLFRQPVTNIEWDMNNSQGIPIASGIYLIHVVTPNDGERVLKWLCVNRPFDSSSF